MQGVVTFVHAPSQTIFLSDATGSILVTRADQRLPLPAPGESVTVAGTTAPGTRFPTVQAGAIQVAEKVGLPLAREITFEQAMSGAEEAQWVKVNGQLRQIETLDGWLRLVLETPQGNFSVSIPTLERPSLVVGDMLQVRGVCSVWLVTATMKIGGFFLYAPTLAEVQVMAGGAASPGVLTEVKQVRNLRADEAKSGRAVQLHGVVTFAHAGQRIFYLNDNTDGVIVWLADKTLPLPAVGSLVSVRGHTNAGVFSATVQGDLIQSGAAQALPAPRPVSLEQALTGTEDSQWVEMRGHLRQVETGSNWLRLKLTSAVGEFTVSIPDATSTEAKVGSFLLVRGVCQTWQDDKNRIGGVFLYTPSLNQIEVINAPPTDPFAAPEEKISNLGLYRMQTLQWEQLRISGIVLHHEPGHYVVVENDSGVVRALSRSDVLLRPGDRVEVVGIPGSQGKRPVLRDAVYRRTSSGPTPVPLDPPGGLKLDPALEGRLVTVTGWVVNLAVRPEDTRLLLQTDSAVREMVYDGKLPASVSAAWKPGCEIKATGLYVVEYDDAERPKKFSLQLRSPADVLVLATPSWWTARRALTGLGAAGGLLVLGLLWVAALHRQVRRQTDVIRAQWEKETSLQARHGEIIANASDLIFTIDLNGRFTSFNPAGTRLTRYSQEEVFRLRLSDIIAAPDAAIGTAILALAHAPGSTPATRFEARFQTSDGRLVWMEISARLIYEAGKPAGLLGIARDVTERKHVEAEKEKLEDLNRQLQKSESLGRMAGAIAHHFNNQLLSVMLGLEMAMDDLPKNSEVVGSLSAAMRAARKAAEVSTLMLTYLGQSPAQHELLDLSETCRRLLPRLLSALPRGVALESHLPAPGPNLSANAEQIKQVLTVLITNAWEAGGEAGGTIQLSIKIVAAADIPARHRFPIDCHPSSSAHACLEVKDAGCGISESDIEKIFDPFFSSKSPGRGMGLAVALGIIRAHDGVITVESEPGRGTVFQVFLPLPAEVGAK